MGVLRFRLVVPGRDDRSMGSSLRYQWGSVSITGNFRENNEDNFLVDDEGHFFLVADGMGGQCAGEKASELAIELISQRLNSLIDFDGTPEEKVVAGIDAAVSHANSEIMALGEIDPNYRSMGTTITFIVVVDGHFYIGGVGDSRAYLLRDGKLEQLTEDHSLTQALVKAGTIKPEEAGTHRYKNVLYRYLGTKDGGAGTEPARILPQPGDRFMLCSDGVSDGAKPETLLSLLGSIDCPQTAAEEIVKSAQEGGSRDNITCVVVHVL